MNDSRMVLAKGPFVALLTFVASVPFLYVLFSGIENGDMATLLAPMAELLIAALMLIGASRSKVFRRNWILLAMIPLSYGLVDVAWAICDLGFGIDPDQSLVIAMAYLIPNLFLLLTVVSWVRMHYAKWHLIQLFVNIVALLAVLLDGFWVLFYKEWVALSFFSDPFSIVLFLYILMDLLALCLIGLFGFSTSAKHASIPLLIVVGGFLLYTFADMYYIYQSYQDTYVANNWVDATYVTAMMLLGIATLIRLRNPVKEVKPEANAGLDLPVNVRWRPAFLLLLLPPVVLWMAGEVRWTNWVLAAMVFQLHAFITGLIYVAAKSQVLLRSEQQLKESLELRVAERTEALLEANQELDHIARQDLVTGLVNRRRFQECLDTMIHESGSEKTVAIVYMDLDRFKAVNDSYGHEVGDKILHHVARRLESLVEPDMLLARLGGDEYIVAMPGFSSEEDLIVWADRFQNAVGKPIILNPWSFTLSVSIGITRYPMDAMDRGTLMTYADIAMYHAKSASSGKRYAFYSPWFSEGMRRRHEIEMGLRSANYDKEFHLVFQPQFMSKPTRLVGMEALLRWNAPRMGNVSPGEFIPTAEETGLIVPIGEWVAKQAMRQISKWNRQHDSALRMGINFSARQFDATGFLEQFRQWMKDEGVHPSWVDVEITESSAMQTETSMEEMLTALTGLGVTISIDDFGTGYSSLSYIKRFDIDALKIAKPLVDRVALDEDDASIVGAIVVMAKSMRLRTIAEGVEDEFQLETLRRLGCDEIQGFLLGKPVTADQFELLWLSGSGAVF